MSRYFATVPINGVHVYEIPIPSSFLHSGGRRGIDIALAYSPRTRVRRLDYMATRMEFHLVRGLPLKKVTEVFAQLEGEDLDDTEDMAAGAADDPSMADTSTAKRPPSPSQLGGHVVKLEPATQVRSRGANQLGRRVFTQRLNAKRDTPMHLVVRSINRWDDPDGAEPYALAAALWRDADRPEIHAELEAQLEAVIELPVELEIEI